METIGPHRICAINASHTHILFTIVSLLRAIRKTKKQLPMERLDKRQTIPLQKKPDIKKHFVHNENYFVDG